MKKQVFILLLFISQIQLTKAQLIEDFESSRPTTLPTNWIQNNVDGNPVSTNSSIATYSFGTNAWVTHDLSAETNTLMSSHGKIAVSTSYYYPSNISNDWLISPPISISSNFILEWEAMALDFNYPDSYQVLASSTGTIPSAFTTILTVVGQENPSWTKRTVSLNAFAGQTIRIAFLNNSNDKFICTLIM